LFLAELDEAGNQAKTYTLGNEYAGHVSELNNSLTSENKAASYYITDEQGSIRYILDQSGEVLNFYQYSAFGETIISEETTPNRLRYNAQTEDELTGLYYLRARYYAPNIGRFTQEDVIYNDGLNLYAYCNSNPVMYSDPSGFAKETCKSKVGGECGSETSYGKSSSNCTELVPYYPANNGAVPGTEKKIYLMAGDKIDRFGGKKGKFFSPTGTPMEMRALPYDADLSQYRQFEVVKPFEVEASTIAPAFGNIGLGTQYRSSVSVDVLLKKGIIKQVGGN
jgi:RHS repeat-associated protein